jgi:hypothetical protein
MAEYEFRCAECGERLVLGTQLADPFYETHHESSGEKCPGRFIRYYSFGIGKVSGAGGSPGKASRRDD